MAETISCGRVDGGSMPSGGRGAPVEGYLTCWSPDREGACWGCLCCPGSASGVVPATPATACALLSALLLRSSSALRCSSASVCCRRAASRCRRSFMIIWGVRMFDRSAWVTGVGPPVVRVPPLAGRLAMRSDIAAFSSTVSGVKAYGARIASSSTKRMADAVRREMRRAGCGSERVGSRDWDCARGRGAGREPSEKRTRRWCCWLGSTERARWCCSKLGVRRKLWPEELETREWLCWAR
jgi:hypothetical protein